MGYLESLQLFYTPNNQLEKSIKIHQQGFEVTTTTTHYFYDAFGRRIGKSSSIQKSSKLNQRGQLVKFPSNLSSLNTTDRPQRKNTLMLWDGNQQIQEYTDEQIFTTVYEQGSFEPVARVVQLSEVLEKQRIAEKILYIQQHVPSGVINQDFYDRIEQAKTPLLKIYHYHCNHLGTPQELSDEKGDVIWLSYDRAWGGSFDTIYKPQFIDNFALNEFELQPIKFQGQSLDTETGLHYNRFRYYDSDVGMFISRDPIGLLGGNNVFQYAPNPIGWIDPYGLSKFKPVTFPPEQVIEQVSIAMQGSRKRDFKEANRVAALNGVRGKPTQNAHRDTHGKVTWHHVDYDSVTNTATMQLVTEADHEAKIPHSGSVSEFETTHGVTYGTPEAKKYAKDLNTKLGNHCV